jgi:rare lipoprotein A
MWLPTAGMLVPIGVSVWVVSQDIDPRAQDDFQGRFHFDRTIAGDAPAQPGAGVLTAPSLLSPAPLGPPATFSHHDGLVPPTPEHHRGDAFERMLTNREISPAGINPSSPPSPTRAELSPVPALRSSRSSVAATAPIPPDRPVGRSIGTGRASWYEHPGRTASGETFDPAQLTAAHRTLPFGKRITVVNLRNGRSVGVRINDRTPPNIKAVIDLSRQSAREIGLKDVGPVALYEAE